jgi:hypothetical protein
LVIGIPDSGGRYYLLPMLDRWTDVFASPGKRTTGTGAQQIALVGPDWAGSLPDGIGLIRAPTAMGWIIGRTQTNGKADYDNVHAFQAGLAATPLSQLGKGTLAAKGVVDPSWDIKTPPVNQVSAMTPEAFFSLATQLMAANPPHANDNPTLSQMRQLGIEPGKPFSLSALPADTQAAILAAPKLAMARIMAHAHRAGVDINGWHITLSGIGTYGTDYLSRAAVAWAGLGANVPDDAIYPLTFTDAEDSPSQAISATPCTSTRPNCHQPAGR